MRPNLIWQYFALIDLSDFDHEKRLTSWVRIRPYQGKSTLHIPHLYFYDLILALSLVILSVSIPFRQLNHAIATGTLQAIQRSTWRQFLAKRGRRIGDFHTLDIEALFRQSPNLTGTYFDLKLKRQCHTEVQPPESMIRTPR